MAGGFLSLTGPLAPRVAVAASPQIIKKGARLAPQVVSKGCVRFRSGGDSACGAEGCGIALWAMSIKSALRDLLFCVIKHEKHSADWLATLAPLSGCAGLPPQAVAEQPVLKVERLMSTWLREAL